MFKLIVSTAVAVLILGGCMGPKYVEKNGPGRMVNGKYTGEKRLYHKDTNILAAKYQVANGLREGEYLDYYKNGKLRGRYLYHEDRMEGEQTSYYINGQVAYIYHGGYKEKNGEAVMYYPNGQKVYETNYKNNKFEGPLKAWYRDGKPAIEANFEDGYEKGKCTYYYKEGDKQHEGMKLNGLDEGKNVYYYKNGNKSSEYVKSRGRLVDFPIIYKENGEIDHFETKLTRKWYTGEKGEFRVPKDPPNVNVGGVDVNLESEDPIVNYTVSKRLMPLVYAAESEGEELEEKEKK